MPAAFSSRRTGACGGCAARAGVVVDPRKLAEADPVARFQLDAAHVVTRSRDQRRATSFFDLVLIEAGVQPSDATSAALAEISRSHAGENLWEIVPQPEPIGRPLLPQQHIASPCAAQHSH